MKDYENYDTLALILFVLAGLCWHYDHVFATMLIVLGAGHLLAMLSGWYRNRLTKKDKLAQKQ